MYFHIDEGAKELCGVSFIRTPTVFVRASPLWTKHLPDTRLPNTISSAMRIPTFRFGGGANIQAIENIFKFYVTLSKNASLLLWTLLTCCFMIKQIFIEHSFPNVRLQKVRKRHGLNKHRSTRSNITSYVMVRKRLNHSSSAGRDRGLEEPFAVRQPKKLKVRCMRVSMKKSGKIRGQSSSILRHSDW